MGRRSSIREALALWVLVAGCYDEQAIELSVQRSDPSLQLGVKACRADDVTSDEHCKPRGANEGYIFQGTTALTRSVHIVISDESDQVLLKLSDGANTECGVITIGDELVHYDVTVGATGFDWTCEGACAPSAGCTY
jgi:hypothetical protein